MHLHLSPVCPTDHNQIPINLYFRERFINESRQRRRNNCPARRWHPQRRNASQTALCAVLLHVNVRNVQHVSEKMHVSLSNYHLWGKLKVFIIINRRRRRSWFPPEGPSRSVGKLSMGLTKSKVSVCIQGWAMYGIMHSQWPDLFGRHRRRRRHHHQLMCRRWQEVRGSSHT